ncbi:HxlR family transcriptional regulator [Haloactinopolyspora alba]|uniref:HxlR family transcriptional regulator n=1 Tax=Haloactinopolyspora alba TaxID=648780 RepID=A0A2P8DXE3_9ACTN|nr:winged helix-turn-helix transcriptional regulator [Haloactinopolyspora alba]PSL01862.1 HxlR family transcriptional regulator [Haloactinopolyspora alba]
MSVRRRYGQGCPVAHALDMIGERWALLVVRELRLGGRRFSDLQEALPGAGPTVLSQRLRDLESVGVLRRRTLPSPANARIYELTDWGAELEPVFRALARWGARSPIVPLEGPISSDSMMLGLRTFFPSTVDPPWSATYEVRITRSGSGGPEGVDGGDADGVDGAGFDSYVVEILDGRLQRLARDVPSGAPDIVVSASRDALKAVLDGTESAAAAVAAGRIDVAGDVETVQRLADASRSLPPAASAR